jgi:protein-disulfide isomerase
MGYLRETIEDVLNLVRPARMLFLLVLVSGPGCYAQTSLPAAGQSGAKLSPELARRVEIMIRNRAELNPEYVVTIGERKKSEVPGFDEIDVVITAGDKASKPIAFLLSEDGKTLAQFNKFDISQDPKTKVVAVDRPGRGGPADAPVSIVVFDDLECPFCARMHAQLFPGIQERYKDRVHVTYLDFPLEQHPWAMHAAIDANCLAAESVTGYWNFVDYVHAHAAEIGGAEKTVAKANEDLDKLAAGEGALQKVGQTDLMACIQKQDVGKIQAAIQQGEALGVDATPALFINGEKLQGAEPLEFVYRMIDGALTAAGQTPPPAYVPPAEPAEPAVKPGN